MSTKSTVATALVALAAGAALGMLFAPASGRDTRKRIVKKATSARDTLEYRMLEMSEAIAKLKDQLHGTPKGANEAAASSKDGQATGRTATA